VNESNKYRELGMDRPIARRDFLNGVALAITAAGAVLQSEYDTASRWTAFQKLGVSRISFPGMWYTSASLDPGSTFGGYQGVTTPEEPIIVHIACTPGKPGLPRKEQNRAGAAEMPAMYDTLNDPDVPPEERPHVIGRQRCGRVAIANSDAGAAAFTNEAFDQANRAVQELFVLNGLT
jgi:spermidine dehydrogenase